MTIKQLECEEETGHEWPEEMHWPETTREEGLQLRCVFCDLSMLESLLFLKSRIEAEIKAKEGIVT